MLARRSLELRPNAQGLLQPCIARETLIDCGRAQRVIEQAQEQAAQVLEQARDLAEAERLDAQARFWENADAALAAWEAQRQAMWEQIEASAARLVNEALRTLLDEVPEPARIDALVRQLASGQRESASATLHCHPDDLTNLTRTLGNTAAQPWTLVADAGMDRHQLRLQTPAGTFLLDWPSTVQALHMPVPSSSTAPL